MTAVPTHLPIDVAALLRARAATAAEWAARGGPPVCYRFPDMSLCGCTVPCRTAVRSARLHPVAGHVVVGSIETAVDVPRLLANGVTHVLDVSNTPYARADGAFVVEIVDLDDTADAPLAAAIPRASRTGW